MAIKKVVIAAAGKGTRMLGLSKDKPKHLIEVNGRPFLSYLLDNLFLAGYTDITLVTGYMPEAMEDFIEKYVPPVSGEFSAQGGPASGWEIKIINQFECFNFDEKNGTVVPLMCVKNVDEQFLYISGDNYYSVEDLKAVNIDDNFNYVSGVESDNPENFGVLVEEGEFLVNIVEKPKEFMGNLVNAGLYKFTPEIFSKINQIEKSPRGEYEITDAVSLLAKEKKVKINRIKDFWMDFGKPEDIEKLSNFLNGDNQKK